MSDRLLLPSAIKLALATLIALTLFSATARAASSEIEGVWSFSGGSVAIQQLSNNTFQGTVVQPTTFAECPHPIEQVMWTGMSKQADGSFWGYHQWYHGSCEPDPQLGPTAWRVLRTPNAARYLKVCFSRPGTSQPKIASDGAESGVTYGCENSALVSPLPIVSEDPLGTPGGGGPTGSNQISFAGSIALPTGKACVRQRSLTIKLHDPKYDPFKEVVITVAGKKVLDVRNARSLKRGFVLRHLPSGTYRVGVLAITVLKQRLSGSRTYHACTRGAGTIKLHRSKPHGRHGHHG